MLLCHAATQYATMQEAQEYFNKLLVSMRQHATVFTVGSILIKPVQRIMRYPLLLDQILRVIGASLVVLYCSLAAVL